MPEVALAGCPCLVRPQRGVVTCCGVIFPQIPYETNRELRSPSTAWHSISAQCFWGGPEPARRGEPGASVQLRTGPPADQSAREARRGCYCTARVMSPPRIARTTDVRSGTATLLPMRHRSEINRKNSIAATVNLQDNPNGNRCRLVLSRRRLTRMRC